MQKLEANDIAFYLLAVKQSYTNGKFSALDCKALASLYVQGGLYMALMHFPELVDGGAKVAIGHFILTVQKSLEAPDVRGDVDLAYQLPQRTAFAAEGVFAPEFANAVNDPFKVFMAELLGGLQADIVRMSLLAQEVFDGDKDDAHYVLGMAEITAQNFGVLVDSLDADDDRDYAVLEKFFNDGCRFVAALRQEAAVVA